MISSEFPLDYLEYYHLKKGYMLSFNINQSKQTRMRRIMAAQCRLYRHFSRTI